MHSAVILYSLVGGVVVVLTFYLSPQPWKRKLISCFRRSRRTQAHVTPVTDQRGPSPTFPERHIAQLRDWRKPVLDLPTVVNVQHQVLPALAMIEIPTLVHPKNVYRPQRAYKMTWREFQAHT